MQSHILLALYTDKFVAGWEMPSMQDVRPGEQVEKQLGVTGGRHGFCGCERAGDGCGETGAGRSEGGKEEESGGEY